MGLILNENGKKIKPILGVDYEIIYLIHAVLLAAVNSGNRKTWQILLPTFRFGSNKNCRD